MRSIVLVTTLIGSCAVYAALDDPIVNKISQGEALAPDTVPAATQLATPVLDSALIDAALPEGPGGGYQVDPLSTYDFDAYITGSASLDLSYSISGGADCGEFAGSVLTPAATGASCVVSVFSKGSGNTTDSSTLLIDVETASLANQNLSSDTVPSPLYLGDTHDFGLGGKQAGATVSYTTSDSSVCTVASDGTITPVAAGTCDVDAVVSPISGYLGATESVSFTVSALTSQPDSLALSTPSNDLIEGDTYTVSVSNQSGSGAITWSVSGVNCSISSGGVLSTTGSGDCAVTGVIADAAPYAGATVSATYSVSSAAAILNDDNSVSVANLTTVGISSSITTDLSTNSNCGSAFDESCIDEFNSYKSDSGCTLGGGDDATTAQVETYVKCVMRASHVAALDTLTASNSSTSDDDSCEATVTLPIPTACAHSQWSCTIQGSTTPGSGFSVLSDGSEVQLTASLGGAPKTATYKIRAALEIYSPAYTKDFTYSVSIPAGDSSPGTQTAQYNSSGGYHKPWNSCLSKGGVLATAGQVKTYKGWSSWPSTYNSGGITRIVYRNDSSVGKTYQHSCSSSWSSTKITDVSLKPTASNYVTDVLSARTNNKSETIKYVDSNGDIQNSNCRDVGASGTVTYFCRQPSYSCD